MFGKKIISSHVKHTLAYHDKAVALSLPLLVADAVHALVAAPHGDGSEHSVVGGLVTLRCAAGCGAQWGHQGGAGCAG